MPGLNRRSGSNPGHSFIHGNLLGLLLPMVNKPQVLRPCGSVNGQINFSKQSLTRRLLISNQAFYTESNQYRRSYFIAKKSNMLLPPVFKSKVAPVSSRQGTTKPAAELTVNDVLVTIFKGAHPTMVSELVKIVVRYAH
ncbi:hypothetical protein FOD75_10980 (plasmid) [Limosilactobacillus reuteri]|uniref:Uncharacterized protein n=1 Tax=Limosilactobacillus reuteri TaxID=1598 RepID=A0A517D8D2_LIMRT|nr:hypothetical protein [Limosilactobacillus reuteri]QDR73613.1 hypothetical protein FOD75_10980 [Limosilactobacillus reuteri]